jgi:hypothetical protein
METCKEQGTKTTLLNFNITLKNESLQSSWNFFFYANN